MDLQPEPYVRRASGAVSNPSHLAAFCDDPGEGIDEGEEVVMQIDELLVGAVAGGVAPGCVAVVGDRDDVVVEATAGEAGPDTVFRLASMTKAMTSVAALQL